MNKWLNKWTVSLAAYSTANSFRDGQSSKRTHSVGELATNQSTTPIQSTNGWTNDKWREEHTAAAFSASTIFFFLFRSFM